MIELAVFLFLGIIFGIITGLIPGLHPNTISLLILSLSVSLIKFGTLPTLIFLVAMGITNSIVDFIPSIILGAPESENALSVLPGHKLLMDGLGFYAIYLTVMGGLYSIFFILALLPILFLSTPMIYGFIEPYIWLILSVFSITLILFEKNMMLAMVFFIIAAILGMTSANANIGLFPILSGLFGISTLLNQLSTSSSITKQKLTIKKYPIKKSAMIGAIGGIISGLLPAITSSQIAAFMTKKTEDFLVMVGAITTANIFMSIMAIKLISHPRSGVAIVINEIMKIGIYEIYIIILISIISVIVASISTIKISRFLLKGVENVNYKILNIGVLVFINILIFLLSGPMGLLVAWTGGFIGLSAILFNVRRYVLMSCLLVPTILFYIGI